MSVCQRLSAAVVACGLLWASVGSTPLAAQYPPPRDAFPAPAYDPWYEPADWYGPTVDYDYGDYWDPRDAVGRRDVDDRFVDEEVDLLDDPYGYGREPYDYDLYTDDWYYDKPDFGLWYDDELYD